MYNKKEFKMNIYIIRPVGYNIGNDIIFISMKYFIKEAFGFTPNLITIPATAKYSRDKRAGFTKETVYEMNQLGDCVIVGGGNLLENGELDIDIEALKHLRIPLFLFSLSRGRIYDKDLNLVDRTDTMSNDKIRTLLDKSFLCLSRDITTESYLWQFVENEKLKIGGCPSLFFDKAFEAQNILPDVPTHHWIVISIRNPNLMSIPISQKKKVRECIEFIISIEKNVILLCPDYRDITFAESFGIEYFYTQDVYSFLSVLKNARRVISFRLHSTLPCFCMHTPVVNISYDERALSMLETINCLEYNIELLRCDVRKEVNRFLEPVNRSKFDKFYNIIMDSFKTFAKEIKNE